MDLSPVFNQALAAHNVSAIEPHVFRVQDLDEFLKEAYRIRAHVVELHTHLRSVRQSYLSTAAPPRRKQFARTDAASGTDKDTRYLTDAQRSEIDASAKQLLRDLNRAISSLQDAEQVRQETDSAVALKKRARKGLGALGRWAAGGATTAKSPEEETEEAKAKTLRAHRESIIWYLQRQLETCGRFQSSMMEIRLTREVEKSKSVLYKARGTLPTLDQYGGSNGSAGGGANVDYRGKSTRVEEMNSVAVEEQLDPEQLQLFAQENQDLLRHCEDHLDQVRTAEKSLLEISELQTTIANNLSIQSAHIEQLVEDSFRTTDNVGTGNRELRRATERGSTAQKVFHATWIFCLLLILMDLFV